MKQHKRIIWGSAIFLIAIAGIIGVQMVGKDTRTQYTTALVDRADLQQTVSSSGTLNPVTLVSVGTQVSGVVREIHADFNDHVTEGQVLLGLDQSLLLAQSQQSQGNLASAQASLKQANANLARTQALFKKDYIARADLEKAEQDLATAAAQVKIAEGQVERDKVNLSYTVIRSPVSGVVVSRDVDVGQTVAASFQTPTLFKIAQDLKKMQIDTNLSEADVGDVKEAMKVKFTVDAFQGRNFEGQVRQVRLNPTTVQNVVTYNVVIDVNNDDLSLLPGMTAFVTIIEDEKANALRVPNGALTYRPSDSKSDWKAKYAEGAKKPVDPGAARTAEKRVKDETKGAVFILVDNKPKRISVKTGMSNGKFTEIVASESNDGELKEGDLVITDESSPDKKPKTNQSPGGMRGGPPRLF